METSEREQTIVPVKPGLQVSAPRVRAPRAGRLQYLLTAVVAIVLGAGALGVFFLLPHWQQERAAAAAQAAAARAAAQAAAAAAAPAAPQLSPEEIAALKAKSETLLANLLTQGKRLDELHADAWGGDQWTSYKALSTAGDDAYLAKDYALAAAKYGDATATGEALLARSAEIVASALAAAEQALAAGNSDVALAQFDIVLGIEPERAAAKAGRARAERLPKVLELAQKGDQARDAGDLEAAAESYRAALAIDPAWEPASRALAAVSASISEAKFQRLMSAGFSAITAKQFNDAAQQFHAALAMRPQSREAQDGLAEAEQGEKLDKISLTEARALAFEKRELWNQAIALYRGVLATDPNLTFAQTGLDRAENRAGLEAKLLNLIDNPTLLFSDSVLSDAGKLVEEASAQPDRGPRLEEQIGKLSRLVKLASTPIAVELHSDQQTQVTLYRVGALGTFMSKQVDLRPGTYTVIGSRNGFRDVRKTFTVLPGRDLDPINVVCAEHI